MNRRYQIHACIVHRVALEHLPTENEGKAEVIQKHLAASGSVEELELAKRVPGRSLKSSE
jgi:hypothetical protein